SRDWSSDVCSSDLKMQSLQEILVIIDPNAPDHASLAKAELLAERFGARIELYICDTKAARATRLLAVRAADPSQPIDLDLMPLLEGLAEPMRQRGLAVRAEVGFAERLADGLLERTLHTSADLIIKDAQHHSTLSRTLFSSTDWHLIRHCPRPLLFTKGKPWSATPTIIGAVDPGHLNDKPAELDHRILQWGRTLAEGLNGTLHAVHAYIPLTIAAAAANLAAPIAHTLTPQTVEYEEHEKRKELHELTDRYGIDRARVHLELGVAADVIPDCAAELDADLVVMGAIARTGLERIFIGSTAERVLDKLPCDVLIVKSPAAQ